MKGRGHIGEQSVDRKVISTLFSKFWTVRTMRAFIWNTWWAFVITAMNIGVPYRAGDFFTS
jgi:hypothetical protein